MPDHFKGDGVDHFHSWVHGGYCFGQEARQHVLSVGAGRKVMVVEKDGLVIAFMAKVGPKPYDWVRCFRRSDGTFDRPNRGSRKMMERLEQLISQARIFGMKSIVDLMASEGVCCICGAALTDPTSVSLGIGPECRKNPASLALAMSLGKTL